MRPQKQPWWLVARTPRTGFLLGGFWAFLAAYEWSALALDPVAGWRIALRLVVASGATLLAAVYLGSATVMRRRAARGGPGGERREDG